jgi:broad specificity phosphatase PhoE
MVSRIYFVRHGDTAWSKSGKHTGRTEIPLCAEGEHKARLLEASFAPLRFSRVLTSPRQRAQRTCELAGFGPVAETEPDLAEWDYGDYEGMRSADILRERPGWNLFRDGCPGGESPAQVSERADRLLSRIRAMEGDVALFSHGHFGRVLAARWVGLAAADGQYLLLDAASVGVLTSEHGDPGAPVIGLWNLPPSDRLA